MVVEHWWLTLLGEAEYLHFFCLPCEGRVFNLINKKNGNNSSSYLGSSDLLSTVTDTISKAIGDLQTGMQTTITGLLSGP